MLTTLLGRRVLALAIAAAISAVACGDDITSHCCVNGAFYDCSDVPEQSCTTPGHDCVRKPERDNEC